MDPEAKKKTLRIVPYGLYLVGVRSPEVASAEQDLNAFVASWVTQCSFQPPLVALGVRKDSRSHGMIVESGVFALNFLGEDQKALATTFFKELAVDEKSMSGVAYEVGATTGTPLFPDLPASLECRVVAVHDHGGDHSLIVGEVVDAHHRRESAPLTHKGTGWNYAG